MRVSTSPGFTGTTRREAHERRVEVRVLRTGRAVGRCAAELVLVGVPGAVEHLVLEPAAIQGSGLDRGALHAPGQGWIGPVIWCSEQRGRHGHCAHEGEQ